MQDPADVAVYWKSGPGLFPVKISLINYYDTETYLDIQSSNGDLKIDIQEAAVTNAWLERIRRAGVLE